MSGDLDEMKKMHNIAIFDPSMGSHNMGDFIIADAVKREVSELAPHTFICHLPSHHYPTKANYWYLSLASLVLVGGSNLLSSNMFSYNQWKIGVKDAFRLKNVVLMGVGWWQYQQKPDLYTKFLLNRILQQGISHSVRDSFTKQQLTSAGFQNVVNTGCMTLWNLTDEHIASIPQEKSDNVVMTLTDYQRDLERDRKLFSALKRNYSKVYLWLSGNQDFNYSKQVVDGSVEYVDPTLAAYDELLSANMDLDYVGTRLHGGIRAMQHKRRTHIMAVDNRAIEKKKDFNLPVILMEEIDRLDEILKSPQTISLDLPFDAINDWRDQIRKIVSS